MSSARWHANAPFLLFVVELCEQDKKRYRNNGTGKSANN